MSDNSCRKKIVTKSKDPEDSFSPETLEHAGAQLSTGTLARGVTALTSPHSAFNLVFHISAAVWRQ